MIDQLALFPEEVTNISVDSNVPIKDGCDYRKSTNSVEARVFVYVLVDRINRKTYVGHTIEPEIRIAYHLAGKTNSSLKEISEHRPNDLTELCRYEFVDPNYSHSEKSIAKWVEAFLIAYYDSLNDGYNVQYNYDHDFLDIDFWVKKLPPNIVEIYLESDHYQLNKHVEDHLSFSRQVYKSSKNEYERIAKKLLREQLNMYHSMPIKYTTIISDSGIANVGNDYKFRKGSDTVLSIKRVYELVKHFEEVLGREVKFDLYTEIEKLLLSKHSS